MVERLNGVQEVESSNLSGPIFFLPIFTGIAVTLVSGDIIHTMSDSIKELTAEICAFRDARDWAQFHNPKEMAVAIAAEAGELLQYFVWQDAGQSLDRVATRSAEIESEMADVAILLFEMAANCQVDLGAAMRAKLARNEERYSVSKSRGSNKKYNEL